MADNSQSGHRKRLRERFLAVAPDTCSDEMLLELLLTFAVTRRDTKQLAQELIRIFGSLSGVLSASAGELDKIRGLGQASVTLLKVVNFIQSGTESSGKKGISAKRPSAVQQKLFKDRTDKQVFKHPSSKKIDQRKLQVSNGYFLEFDQLARVLHFLLEHRGAKKISRKVLQEETGLSERQVEGLVSMGSAMGLIKPGLQILTPIGLLISEHDIFFEKKGTLEWCHYHSAGAYQNLIWFEVFNNLLVEEAATNQQGWQNYFREKLRSQYADKTIKKHLPQEIRFVIDAYMKRNFNKLGILQQSSNESLYRRRYSGFASLVFVAMIYDFCVLKESRLSQVGEMVIMPGSPAMVFGLDTASFRQEIEGLHDHGWLRYETTHNLDQIRLKSGFCALEFLTAYFEDREPVQNDESGMMTDG